MGFIVTKCGEGIYRPQPVSAFHLYNTNTQSCADAATTVFTMNAGRQDGGGLTSFVPTNRGWYVTFGTMTFSSWNATLTSGVVYRSLAMGFGNQEQAGMTAPQSWQTGNHENSYACGGITYVTAPAGTANMNTYQDSGAARVTVANSVRASGARIAGPHTIGARVTNSAAQALTANVEAIMTVNTEGRDDGGLYTTATPNRITVPTDGEGWYIMSGHVHFPSGGTVHRKNRASLRVNGSTRIATEVTNGMSGTKVTLPVALYYMNATDYVQTLGFSSAALSTVNTNVPYAMLSAVRLHRDNLPGACISRTTTQSIASNVTLDPILFNNVVRDSWGMSQVGGANPSRLTVPEGHDGWYICVGNLWWTANTSGVRRHGIYLNGNAQWMSRYSFNAGGNAVSNDPACSVGAVLYLVAGDYVELKADNIDVGANTTQADQVFLALVKVP